MGVNRVHIVSLLLFNLCVPSTLSKESFVNFVCPTEIPQLPFAWKYYLPGPLTVPGPTNWTGECVCVKKEHTSMSHVILSLHLFISRNVRLDTVTWKKNIFPVEIHKFVTPAVSRFPISGCSICYGSTGRKFLHWAEKVPAAQADGGVNLKQQARSLGPCYLARSPPGSIVT